MLKKYGLIPFALCFLLAFCSVGVIADGGVTFVDIAGQSTRGLTYERVGSTTVALAEALHRRSLDRPATFADLIASPMMPRGLPGVAIFDHDGDGDLDVYVTNGPGAANSLFSSQLEETGQLWFVDVAVGARADLTAQDSFGVCFGDLDNDGDSDLLVTGRKEPNRLLENLGDGQFLERPEAGLGGGDRTSTGCAMGDIDLDGWLDVVVANSFDMTESTAIWTEPFALNEANALYRNRGHGVFEEGVFEEGAFEDVSSSSGILRNGGYPEGAAGITWTAMMADVDLDGDTDIVFMDDQGAMLPARVGGLDRAFIHVFLNDGHGHFVDSPIALDENSAAEWMGVDIGDLDCDGHLDLFVTSFGDYGNAIFGVPFVVGAHSSRPFFGHGDGTFRDPGLAWGPPSSVFGWGVGLFDYDNDADLDVLYHGGLDATNILVVADNPGALLQNQGCSGRFVVDMAAIRTDHTRRNVRALGIGDLDRNGFVDVVTAANFRIAPDAPLLPVPARYGSLFDDSARFAPIMKAVDEGFVWLGYENSSGDLAVELAKGHGNPSVTVEVEGGAGRIAGATVNRDGIGAILTFTPEGGAPVTQVVTGGASHSSQHALDRLFGFGNARRGTLDVLWPGGTRNRVYDVRPGRLVLTEIPCRHEADWEDLAEFTRCVRTALRGYRVAGSLSARQAARLLTSSLRAYRDR